MVTVVAPDQLEVDQTGVVSGSVLWLSLLMISVCKLFHEPLDGGLGLESKKASSRSCLVTLQVSERIESSALFREGIPGGSP
jgi:hypothetical protein